MSANYRVLQTHDLQIAKSHQQFALDVLLGLSISPKALSSKYLYDAEGDQLFQKITQLPEYYLTKCELEIFQNHKERIIESMGPSHVNLVELGAGDGQKTEVLLGHCLSRGMRFRYVPIDISETAVRGLIGGLGQYSPQIQIEGLVADYFDGLKWLSNMTNEHNVVLFLGSNIGNFSHSEARVFLYSLWNALNDGDHLLIGFDLKKSIPQLLNAYNDCQGVTTQFNLNILRRINRELGGSFDLNKFQFYSSYNVFSGAVESYLMSMEKQSVNIEVLNQSFFFDEWEPIHTEYSHKFLQSDITTLAEETGFQIVDQLVDSKGYFIDSIWQVKKGTEINQQLSYDQR
ncbi:MAG: L-histidine N(alpha)-methyltransferase [Chloroflexota bacterium]|nr:L-histidine N(alpha)-methyltransferase [Chloroflexota bacterium]